MNILIYSKIMFENFQWNLTINRIQFFSSIGWRLGLQAVTGVVFITFLLGTFYRSASLYHPQRRAILHLKSQKRKIKNKDKEKNKVQDDAPPFFDFTTLRSRTVQLLLGSIAIASVGMNTPIFYLVCSCVLISSHSTWRLHDIFYALIFQFANSLKEWAIIMMLRNIFILRIGKIAISKLLIKILRIQDYYNLSNINI